MQTIDRLRVPGAVAGILFAVLGVASGVIVPPPPALDASASTVRSYVTDHRHGLDVWTVLVVVAPIVLLVFFAAARRRFADRELGSLFFGFGLLTVALALLGALLEAVLIHGGAILDNDQAVLVLFRLGAAVFYGGPALASLGYLVAAAADGPASELPGWLSPFALLVGVVGFVGGIVTVTTSSGGPAAL